MKTLKELLIELKACKDAIEWAQDRTIEQAVTDCHRADWILWLATKMQCDKRKLVLCGGLCANTVRQLMTDERSTKSVDTAIAYGQGNASDEELTEAGASARAEARAAARAAPWTSARAAAEAAARATAWTSARAAPEAAARATAWTSTMAAAEAAALKGMSEIVKPIIGQQLIQKVNNLLQ